MLTAVTEMSARWVDVLLRESLFASVVFVAVLGLSLVLKRRGPSLHVALWSLVFIRLVLPPDLGHPLSAGAVMSRLDSYRMVVTKPYGAETRSSAGMIEPHSKTRSAESGGGGSPLWKTVFAALWLTGFTVVWFINRRRLNVFRRAAHHGANCTEANVACILERWRRCLGVRRRARVVISDAGLPPFTLGIIRPVICLPRGLVDDPVALESVMAHEMAHVARLDALWLRLQHLLQAVYFFHPLVWISGIKLNDERERLCDATVVATGRLAARDYVGGLLNVLRLDLQGVGAPTMTARKRRIGVRIQRVLSRDGGSRPRVAVAVAAVAALGVFLLPLSQGSATAMSDDVVGTVQNSSPASAGGETEFINPLPEGRVTWTWGPDKREPFTGKKVFHRGIDVAAAAGTEILAPADGIVTAATEDFKKSPSSGTVVIIDHGTGLTTTYSHLGSFEVEEGQEVSQGDVIATVGSTGKSTGPHLHFEIWRDGETQDPATFVEEWKK